MLPANTEFIGGWCKFTVRKKIALSKIQNVYSACYNVSLIRKRAISLQKVHLWMEISAACSNRGRRSLTKMDKQGNVQSSVWTLQQILPEFVYHDFLQKLYAISLAGFGKVPAYRRIRRLAMLQRLYTSFIL